MAVVASVVAAANALAQNRVVAEVPSATTWGFAAGILALANPHSAYQHRLALLAQAGAERL